MYFKLSEAFLYMNINYTGELLNGISRGRMK